jgi:hypothetical protein
MGIRTPSLLRPPVVWSWLIDGRRREWTRGEGREEEFSAARAERERG